MASSKLVQKVRKYLDNTEYVKQQKPKTVSLAGSLKQTTGASETYKTEKQRAESQRSRQMRSSALVSVAKTMAKKKTTLPSVASKMREQSKAQAPKTKVSNQIARNALAPVKNYANTPKVTGGQGVGNYGFKTNVKQKAIAPAKEIAEYTRKQQNKYVYTPNNDYRFDAKGNMLMKKDPISIEYGEKLRAGMPSSNSAIMSWRSDPTEKELEYRDKYGYTQKFNEAVNRRLNDNLIEASYSPTTGKITEAKNGRAMSAGFTDAFARENLEDTMRRQYGSEPDEQTLQQIEQQRQSINYGAGMMAGQMAQYALTRGLLSSAGLVGKGAKGAEAIASKKDAIVAFAQEMGIDQVASVPLNLIDAMKADGGENIIKRFGLNQGLDLAFGILFEVPALRKNLHFVNGNEINNAANAMEESAQKLEAKLGAKQELNTAVDETGDVARNEAVEISNAGYHAGDLGKAESYFSQASGNRGTGHLGTGTYFTGSREPLEVGGYASRPLNEVSFDNYNTYRPSGYEQGIRVHDNLAVVDKRSAKGLLNDYQLGGNVGQIKKTLDEIQEGVTPNNIRSKVAEVEDIAKRYLPESRVNEIEQSAREAYEYELARVSDGNYTQNRFNEYRSALSDIYSDDEIDDALILDLIESEEPPKVPDLDEFRLNYYISELENELNGKVPFGRTSLAEHIDNAQTSIKQLAQDLGKTEDEVLDAIKNAADKVEKEYPSVSQASGRKDLDSEATLVMKNLGYEGVDNRGIEGLDNTEYGSVIYDLKPETKRRQIREGAKETAQKAEPKPKVEEPKPKEEPKVEPKAEEKPKEEPKLKEEPKPKEEPKEEPKAEEPEVETSEEKIRVGKKYTDSDGNDIFHGTDGKRYRNETMKKIDDRDISRSADTLRGSDRVQKFVDDIEESVAVGGYGNKMGRDIHEVATEAFERVKKDPEAVRIKLDKATVTAKEGKLPEGYDNLQDYYADVGAMLDHYSGRLDDLEAKGLDNSEEYLKIRESATNFLDGLMSVRSQEGYGAVQYNLLAHSNGEVRVALIEREIKKIEDEFEKELEKAAKKNSTVLEKADKVKIKLSDAQKKAIKNVDPDDPLQMSRVMHDVSKEVWDQIPASKHEVADAIRKSSMLLNPKTHLRNIFGNTLMIPARIIKDLLGAPLEKIAIKAGKMDAEQATKSFANRFNPADKKYYDAAKKVWKEWKDIVRGDAKFYDAMPTSASKILGKRPIGEGKVASAGIENPSVVRRAVDWIISKNGKALEAEDAMMLYIHFTDSFAQVCKARKLDPETMTKAQLMSVIDAATGEAQRATFRDASQVAKTINGWKTYKKNDTLIQKVGRFGVNTTMPFVNTPINIMRRSWDYSPMGLIHGAGEIIQGCAKGDKKAVKKGIDRLCSGLTGSGVFMVGFFLGRDGGLTARLSDGKEGYYEQDQGLQEYSLNLNWNEDGLSFGGDEGFSISLSQYAPHSIPLFAGVEFANLLNPNEEVNWKALPDVVGRVFDPTMDMSVMQGPMSVLKSIAESDSLGDVPLALTLDLGTNYLMQYVPTISGQFARAIDPVRRDTTSYAQDKTVKHLEKSLYKLQSRIPSTVLTDNSMYNISSTGLQPYKDVWGREHHTFEDDNVKRWAYEFLSPSYVNKKNITAIDKEIRRLNDLAANEDEKVVPNKAFMTQLSFNDEKVDISREELSKFNEIRGKEAYKSATELIKSREYQMASNENKRKMLNKVFTDSNKVAKLDTLIAKGFDEYAVRTEGFSGGKADKVEEARAAGIPAKEYADVLTDKSTDLDENGSYTQYEVYRRLEKTNWSNEQKAIVYEAFNAGWKNNPYRGGYIPDAPDEETLAEKKAIKEAKILNEAKARTSGSVAAKLFEKSVMKRAAETADLLDKSSGSSGSSKRSRSGRRSGYGYSKSGSKRKATESEKQFAKRKFNLSSVDYDKIYKRVQNKSKTQTPTYKDINVKGLTKAQKNALLKVMLKKIDSR